MLAGVDHLQASPRSGKSPPRALLSRLRRLLQFSLRGVLLFTAAIALLMSVVGVPLGRLRQQQLAVERLEKRGCRLKSEAARGPTAWAAAKLFGNSAALHVTEILWKWDDRRPDETDRPDFTLLARLDWVETIDLAWMPFDDAGASNLRGLQYLTSLNLNGANISDRGLLYLNNCWSLERLQLHGAPITDAGLNHLTGLVALENVDFSGTKITGKNLEPLAHLPALEVLNLNGTPLTDDAVAVLSRLQGLQWLGVSDTRLSEAACDALAAALPKTAIDD